MHSSGDVGLSGRTCIDSGSYWWQPCSTLDWTESQAQIQNKLSTWNGPIHWFFSSLAIYLHFAKIILTIAIAVMLQIVYRNVFIFLNVSKMGFLSCEMRLRWYFSLYVNICLRAVTIKETANLSTQQALTPNHFLIRNVLTQCDSVFFLTFINQEMTFFVEIICLDGVFFSYFTNALTI